MGRGYFTVLRTRPACRLTLVIAGVVALLTLAAGCGAEEESGQLVFTEEQNGATVTAAVGDELEVRLTENPSTGYSWTFTASSGLEPRVDDYLAPAASPQLVGAPGTRVVTFVVTGPGRQQIVGVYARSWEDDGQPRRPDFELTVDVG